MHINKKGLLLLFIFIIALFVLLLWAKDDSRYLVRAMSVTEKINVKDCKNSQTIQTIQDKEEIKGFIKNSKVKKWELVFATIPNPEIDASEFFNTTTKEELVQFEFFRMENEETKNYLTITLYRDFQFITYTIYNGSESIVENYFISKETQDFYGNFITDNH